MDTKMYNRSVYKKQEKEAEDEDHKRLSNIRRQAAKVMDKPQRLADLVNKRQRNEAVENRMATIDAQTKKLEKDNGVYIKNNRIAKINA